MKIRPRIFLEGNFFVDMQPGTPGTPTLGDGDTLPIDADVDPVQLDQVLTALQQDTRNAAAGAARQGYGKALTDKPTAAQDAAQDPSVRGLTAAEALNQSYHYGGPALQERLDRQQGVPGHPAARPLEADRGPGTRRRGAWTATRRALKDLITNFNTTMAAFASQSTNLQRLGPRCSRPTLDNADKRADVAERLVPEHARVRARDPAGRPRDAGDDRGRVPVDRAGAPARVARPSSAASCRTCSPTTADLAHAHRRDAQAAAAGRPARQVRDQRDPADRRHQDRTTAPLTTGAENYKEFWYTMVGLAGEGQNFDGNGMYVRFQPGGGDQTISTGKRRAATRTSTLFANAVADPDRHAPRVHRASARRTSPTCPATSSRSRTSTARRPARPTAARRQRPRCRHARRRRCCSRRDR